MREGRTFHATGRLYMSRLVVPASWKLRHREACTPHSDSNFSNRSSPSSSWVARSSKPSPGGIAISAHSYGARSAVRPSTWQKGLAPRRATRGCGSLAPSAPAGRRPSPSTFVDSSTAWTRSLRFETARGSLYEAQAALRVAAAWGFVEKHQAAVVVDALDRLGGRVFGLSRH